MTEPRETSSATTALLLGYVRQHGGDEAVREVWERGQVGLTIEQMQAHPTWIGYDSRIRLFEATTAVLNDPHAMFELGATASTGEAPPVLVELLTAFATPGAVYRRLPRMVPKFTTTSTMQILESDVSAMSFRYRLHEGYEHSRLDCDYARGLLAAVPTLFGLGRATVAHHQCQSDGYDACTYEVTWSPRIRWWRKPGQHKLTPQQSVAALRQKVKEVQLAAADLVSSEDLDEMLNRIVDRADSVLYAPAHLLVIQTAAGQSLIRSTGLEPEEAERVAGQIQRGENLGDAVVVVPIESTRSLHGYLAALFVPGHGAMEGEQELLEAYAGHAAAALDLFTALDDSKRESRRTSALLGLAHKLAVVDSAQDVSEAIATALPEIAGCDFSAVLMWDPTLGVLETVATAHFGEQAREILLTTTIRASETPELVHLLAHHEPMLLGIDDASPQLTMLMVGIGVPSMIAVPLLAGDKLMGVAVAAWCNPVALDREGGLLARIEGVSQQGAKALENAHLLATVREQSLHDSLTGLPNRTMFTGALDTALAECGVASTTAVLFCDLDNFKRVNDEFGHGSGDELLRQLAERLRAEVGDSGTIGRLSGDEFAIVLPDGQGQAQAVDQARRIVDSLNVPFPVDGRGLRITASVGVALHTGTNGRGGPLLAAADAAMYDAKRLGRNQVCVSNELSAQGPLPLLQQELAGALKRDELRLHFQPIVDMSMSDVGEVVGVEALMRWAHPRLGLLAPAAFLPLAEETGLIAELDLWAIGIACEAVANWPENGSRPKHVAVNLSSTTLVDERLLPTVRAALRRYALSPERLILEVIESRALVDVPSTIERLTELRQFGVRISLDDFGTGFSTLAWLKALPVDQIKIDRSFIKDLPDEASVALVQALLALAQKLNIGVIAEGVETLDQLHVLRDAGCSLVQGYLLGRPAPALTIVPALAAQSL
ncbi:sensor domain-containing phosphodiesterase [Cryobacterium sp. CG_9.6]|uniref:putative bifunctional diguanylate cyclase/phosphodiesterase n=1 Tax=Cryobacterium sp. CG_9.6 TaxID=2760710 RepID=UPI00247686A7|nr:sensor domain-containing phosphodiesterase [Cryobacterium sp. CG_9.6]MDH6237853.1 diguanylate cyclase (GGDEF)-like protein [Cryobacterium sp. CG_9.6]